MYTNEIMAYSSHVGVKISDFIIYSNAKHNWYRSHLDLIVSYQYLNVQISLNLYIHTPVTIYI